MENAQDWQLLSAYIDGELSPTEQANLEARLQTEPALQADYATLQQIKTRIHQLPILKAPRNYTLDPARFGSSKVTRLRWPIWVSTAAAVLMVALGLNFMLSREDHAEVSRESDSVSGSAIVQQSLITPTPPSGTQVAMVVATSTVIPPTHTVLPTQTTVPTTLPTSEDIFFREFESELIPESMQPPSNDPYATGFSNAGGGDMGEVQADMEMGMMAAAPPPDAMSAPLSVQATLSPPSVAEAYEASESAMPQDAAPMLREESDQITAESPLSKSEIAHLTAPLLAELSRLFDWIQ